MSLQPGDTLLRCSGQDVTRKGAKGKGRIMMSLPAQLALGKNCDGQLGTLEKADTDNPEFVVTTIEGTYYFPGEFICSTNNYFTISCEPKKRQSVCQDVFDRLLVFKEPVFVPLKTSINMNTSLYHDEIIESNEGIDKLIRSSQATDLGLGNQYSRYHGCSQLAEPVKVSTEKLLNKLSTIYSAEVEDNDSDSDSSSYMLTTDEININRRLSSRSTKSEVKYNEGGDNSDPDFDDTIHSQRKVNKKSTNSQEKEKVESTKRKIPNNNAAKKKKAKEKVIEINLASDSDSDVVVNRNNTKKSTVSKSKSDSTSKSKINKQNKRKRESSDDDDDDYDYDKSTEFSDVDADNDVLNVSNISSRSSRDRKKINYSQLYNDSNKDDEDDTVDDINFSDGSDGCINKKVKKVSSTKSMIKSKPKKNETAEAIDLLQSSEEEWNE